MAKQKKYNQIIVTLVAGFFPVIGSIIGSLIQKFGSPNFNININANLFLFPVIGAVFLTICGVGLTFILQSRWKTVKDKNGIVPVKTLQKKRRLPGENLAAELLTKDVTLKFNSQNETIKIIIDRNNVQEAVINSQGKKTLAERLITTRNKNQELAELDKRVHDFLRGKNLAPNPLTIRLSAPEMKYHLRWASGGILSVINYCNRKWIPFFFRDIRPYGWNISLGSSERHFDKKNKLTGNLDDELQQPDKVLCREFLEENLILENSPLKNVENKIRPVLFPLQIDNVQQIALQLNSEHRKLRELYDNLKFGQSDAAINATIVSSNTQLEIIKSGMPNGIVNAALACINLLEQGIEVVKIFSYNLAETNELLDGEVLETFDGQKISRELTRMPVAFISYDYLQKTFKNDLATFNYTLGAQPSIDPGRPIPAEEIILFKWDLQKRLDIIHNPELANGTEYKRYMDWYDKFHSNFFDEKGNITTSNVSRLFTPATAKILNLLFK